MNLRCDNCGRTYAAEGELACVFPDIPDLLARIEPGGTVPHGECPNCGRLVYDVPEAEYLVNWSVNVGAGSFRQAAALALEMQRDPDSTAVVFDVVHSASGVRQTIDLQADDSPTEGWSLSVWRCLVCGERATVLHFRDHLESHNPNAAGMDWDDIQAQFAREDADEQPTEAEAAPA
jgi:hypothetical protein